MDIDQELESLRRERDVLGARSRGRPYPDDFVARVRRVAAAVPMPRQRLCRALGISDASLAKWLRRGPARLLLPVEVAPSPEAPPLVVHGPAGLRIEGLDLDGLAGLLKRLS